MDVNKIIEEFGYKFDFEIKAVKDIENRIVKKQGLATAHYCTVAELRYLLTKCYTINDAEYDISFAKPKIEKMGAMFDNSRHGVINLCHAKNIVKELAKLGYDYVEMYTEDNYEVDGEPFFGYMRGKWTKEEWRELDSYCQIFGMELVPCIQTLAHMHHIFRWSDYWSIHDAADILLIGEPRTYELIENIIKTFRSCVSSKRINIGMDEADMVGLGNYLKKHGTVDRYEIVLEHLERVNEICKKYDFHVEMWSDMFFKIAYGEYYMPKVEMPAITKRVPKDVSLIYWDYYTNDKQRYRDMIANHRQLTNNIIFGGCCWKHRGNAPFNKLTRYYGEPAIDVMNEENIANVLLTCWGDNGCECSVFSALSSFAFYAQKRYEYKFDARELSETCFKLWCYTFEEFDELDLPNRLTSELNEDAPSKYMLFMDCLFGAFNLYVPKNSAKLYEQYYTRLNKLSKRNNSFSYIFDTLAKLCKTLSLKSEFGLNIESAYRKNDKDKLNELANITAPKILEYLNEYYEAFKKQFLHENRRSGWEQHDSRLGGLMQRLRYVKDTLNEYITGKINKIEELEEERLNIYPGREGKTINLANFMELMSIN